MKKLFTNDKFYAVVTWFATFTAILMALDTFLFYKDPIYYIFAFGRIMIGACLAVTYISYKKHNKNVMKGMIGAVLAFIIMIAVATFSGYIVMKDISVTYIISSAFALVLILVIFVNHFIINSDHYAKPVNIAINQIISIVLAVFMCVESISIISICINVFDTIAVIINCFAQPFGIFSIICIESRIDAYKLDREKAGWTQEKGYPEGYVRQLEKEQKNK